VGERPGPNAPRAPNAGVDDFRGALFVVGTVGEELPAGVLVETVTGVDADGVGDAAYTGGVAAVDEEDRAVYRTARCRAWRVCREALTGW
jgi:hypothetical protein